MRIVRLVPGPQRHIEQVFDVAKLAGLQQLGPLIPRSVGAHRRDAGDRTLRSSGYTLATRPFLRETVTDRATVQG
jgi:hypothetical protein